MMNERIAVELIKLEILKLTGPQETEALNYLRKNFEEFPWKDYGDYQNLAAVLSVTPVLKFPEPDMRQKLLSEAGKMKNIMDLDVPAENSTAPPVPSLSIYNRTTSSAAESQNASTASIISNSEYREVSLNEDVLTLDEFIPGSDTVEITENDPVQEEQVDPAGTDSVKSPDSRNSGNSEIQNTDDNVSKYPSVPDLDIDKEISKIEQELREDLERIRSDLTSPDEQIKIDVLNKKHSISLIEPDLRNVKTLLKETAAINTRDRKASKHRPESIQDYFKAAAWEDSESGITVRNKKEPLSHAETDTPIVYDPVSGREKQELINANPLVSGRGDGKRGLLIILIVLIITAPIAAYFLLNSKSENIIVSDSILSNESFSDSNVKTPTEESSLSADIAQEVIDSSDQKLLTQILPEEESIKELPPLPEKLKIIEPRLDSSGENESSNPVNDSEKLRTSEISIMPAGTMKKISEEQTYFVAVEEMPAPIGGLAEIQKKVIYPGIASAAGIEGKVIINAFVNESGDVTRTEVIKGIGYGCDEAAVNAIKSTKFLPGKQRGKPVNVRITIPVIFRKQ